MTSAGEIRRTPGTPVSLATSTAAVIDAVVGATKSPDAFCRDAVANPTRAAEAVVVRASMVR